MNKQQASTQQFKRFATAMGFAPCGQLAENRGMKHVRRAAQPICWIACLLSLVGCQAEPNSPGRLVTDPSSADRGSARSGTIVKLATWNLEWLVAPQAFPALRDQCLPQGASPGTRRRYLPCDAAAQQDRSAPDFAALARYAKQLDADIIALEEVDGEAAARMVFRGYQFCFTGREAVQNTGFAVRNGLPHRCGTDFVALSLGDSVRRGAELIVYPGDPRELRLLAVHLKSGCARGPLDSGRSECATLARQVPVLEDWIDRQAASGKPFAVLGDFNRDLLHEQGPARTETGLQRNVYAELDDADPPAADLTNAAAGQAFINCSPAQNFNGYIDNILLSQTLAQRRVPGSFQRVTYTLQDATQRKLSDHCPVAVRLQLGN